VIELTRAPVVPYLGPRGRFFDPFYGYGYGYGYDRYLYDPYGYRTGYGYGGYGYGYGYPGTFRPTFVVIDTRQDPEPQGRVVNGRGYTRTTRAPASSGPATAPSSSSGSTTESSSSGEGSSGGSSSSGSGTSTGRTAQPRPPGQ
jgi:hypothetical protein